ncbi:MAG: transposase family protein [Holophagales bacterium]|nr:transposase family protein [Holophagales bacterium]MYF04274.1 transposase family protein [Holophagales bacterium]MYJ26417.1 transposase family protein [Holophagales bacterium]
MAASRATAASAKRFLDRLIEQAPFEVRAIQVDGGSESMADFENACDDRDIELCVLPPRSPQLNGRVERLHATYRHELYGSYNLPHRIESLNRCLDDFNYHFNRQRPHQALGGLTPSQYLQSTAA